MTIPLKLKKMPFVLLCAMGSLGANTSTSRANFYCGKFLYNKELPFKIDYYDIEFPDFTYSWKVYSDTKKTNVVYSSTTYYGSLNESESDPHFIYEGVISASIVKNLSNYCFEIKTYSSVGSIFSSNAKTYSNTFYSGELSSVTLNLIDPEQGQIYNTQRKYAYMEAGILKGGFDSYYVDGVPKADGNYHGINITNYRIGYHDSKETEMKKGNATLYIYTNPLDWNIGSVGYANGKFYRSISLNLNYAFSTTKSGNAYNIFVPSLSQDYAVDRYDTKMYPSSKHDEDSERYFLTRDVFLPSRNGKENNAYEFKLHIFGLDGYGDTIDFNFTVARNTGLFGSCTNADYCVGLGS